MVEYIEREATASAIRTMQQPRRPKTNVGLAFAVDIVNMMPAADVAPMQRWIPVWERLPETYMPVLCYGHNGIMVDYYSGDNSELYHTPLFMICGDKVTHWMPLPEPPKEKTE